MTTPVPMPAPAPDPGEVRDISALRDPVIRNLRITECYYRLSAAMAVRSGRCSNWCTFATWASRQAGCTIRGEDLLARLEAHAAGVSPILHPVRSAWRALLRRGLFRPETRLGRLAREIHSPFDAFERASDAVARGNLKVFEEIGSEFARYLRDCPPGSTPDSPEFQNYVESLQAEALRRAFTLYQGQHLETRPVARAQLVFLANLEIGLHEQTRLQPEIREALEAGPETAEDLGRRLVPAWLRWRPVVALFDRACQAYRRFARDLTRRAITESLMSLEMPGDLVLALGRHLNRPFAAPLETVDHPELRELLERFEPAAGAPDDCGAADWADLGQRMHFIVHLFRAFHESEALLGCPFTSEQLVRIAKGELPDGRL